MGDVWTPWLLAQLGLAATWTAQGTAGKLLFTGSIARFAQRGDTVIGSGIISKTDALNGGAEYLCVRGPETGRKCGCENYGDPALLAPFYIAPGHKREAELTVVPHYVHEPVAGMDCLSPLTTDVRATVQSISGCQAVVSSSLHGIIFAHAYGIPAGWWRPDNRLDGDDVKFEDYAKSAGVELNPGTDPEAVDLVVPDSHLIAELQENIRTALLTWMHQL